jgi:uncharacterized protein
MPNRLALETSPYLLQHQNNPVDWYPWGPEALERARADDRPILLSVGYSACHWCHVMEHESFADPEVAAVMNQHFVNIKVDREERPDIDAIYMEAVQQMTGHGGWPMTVFLTPAAEPFYGGTYFPPEPRHGLPSFRQVLLAVNGAWDQRRDEVLQSAAQLSVGLARGLAVDPQPGPLHDSMLQRAFHLTAARFDARHGGFGEAPKFPQPMLLDFLLRFWFRTGNPEALAMVERTLDAMARGGIYDQLGGGFHRYSVDARWLVPHFEKMLYDNALLSRVYLRAYQATSRSDFRRIAEEVLEYVRREMLHDRGGFFSSQDADSEGVEGKFYVWSAEEIDEELGAEEGRRFRSFYDVAEGGNWENVSILNMPRSLEEAAAESGLPVDRLRQILARGKEILRQVRGRRVWPGRDDKILTSWNAMMLHSFAEAARVLDRADLREIAIRNADFLLQELRVDGRLKRSWRDGEAKIDAFLEDHAHLLEALLELYSATFDVRWLREARWLADRILESFWSAEEETFYDTRSDGEALIVRPRTIYDNATPSGASSAVRGLMALSQLVGDVEYTRVATRVLEGTANVATQIPQAFGHLLGALVTHLHPSIQIAIVGDAGSEETRALLRVANRRFIPDLTLALAPLSDREEKIVAEIPLLSERPLLNGRATAYVCERFTCRQPVNSPEALAEELETVISARS